MRVGFKASGGWNAITDSNHGAPLGELGAELSVFFYPPSESVEPFGHDFARESGNINRSLIDFDPRHNAFFRKNLGKECAVTGGGTNGFIEKNNAADCFLDPLGRQEHFTIGSASVFIGFDFNAIEASLDGARAFIGGKYSLALRNHRPRYGFKFL